MKEMFSTCMNITFKSGKVWDENGQEEEVLKLCILWIIYSTLGANVLRGYNAQYSSGIVNVSLYWKRACAPFWQVADTQVTFKARPLRLTLHYKASSKPSFPTACAYWSGLYYSKQLVQLYFKHFSNFLFFKIFRWNMHNKIWSESCLLLFYVHSWNIFPY